MVEKYGKGPDRSMAAVVVWDQNTRPPAHPDRLLYWRLYDQSESASSIPRYLEDHADRLKRKYLAFIHDLGEYRVGEKSVVDHLDAGDGLSLWWMTLLAEKSPLKSPRIYDCLRLLALEEILLSNRPASLVLVSSDRALAQAISRLCQKLGIHFRFRRGDRSGEHRTVLRRIYEAAPSWLQGLLSLRHSLRRWPLRRISAPNWHSAADDLFICSYFIHLDRDRCSRGMFYSRHWEVLPNLLHDGGRHVNWMQLFLISQVVPDVETGIAWVESFNRDGTRQGLHLFLESYLTVARVVRALGRWVRLVCVKWRLRNVQSAFNVNGSHVWLWPMLRHDWHSSLSGPVALGNCLYLTLFDAALAAMPHQATGLYLCENQAWEKALLHAWRRHGHGEIIGVAHSTVPFWHLYYFDDPRSLRANGNCPMPLPDLLAVNGHAAWNVFADSSYPREKLVEVEALRYLYLARDPKEGRCRSPVSGECRAPGSLRMLVVGDMIPASMDNLLTLLDEAARLMSTEYEFMLKPHPGYAVDLRRFPGLKIKATARPLSELFDHYDVVLAANSTSAAVDAYVALLPVIVAVDGSGLNLSPLRGRQGAYFVSSARELLDSLQSVANGAAQDFRQDDFFFLSPDLHRWKRLLARSGTGDLQE
jgi:surface carbohydrate biosynthesis protein (TIGR04326 family)